MQLSYNWLKELVPDLTASPEEVAEKLTMHSFETEVVNSLAIPAGIKTVQITKLEAHPDADRLRLATVTDGATEVTVVCGAPNIAEGQIVPYSAPGTILQDEDGNDFTIREAKIRGVVSPGMLNSLRELGLHGDHGGIWVLGEDTPLGIELAQEFPEDHILEADITPNRAHDCLSHLGVARELAALYELTVVEPELQERTAQPLPDWQLTIENETDVPLYFGSLLKNIEMKPAPTWMQARLLAAGSRPINNVVDITNYVMLERGNPTHTFDAEKFTDNTIGTRRAREGESIELIDGSTNELTVEDIVVTNNDTPVILGGIMGGATTQVTDETTSVFLEVANFRAFAVQQTSARVKLITEGSRRWVKHVPLALAEPTSHRTIDLLCEYASAELVGTVSQAPERAPRVIPFAPARVAQLMGQPVEAAVVQQMLERVRCDVSVGTESWQVVVPADRLDLEAEHDLVEEVIRLIGLETIASVLPDASLQAKQVPPEVYWPEAVRDTLVELGFTETLNYSFEPEGYAELAGVNVADHLELVNPQAPDRKNLRVSLLPGLLQNLATNREHFHRERDDQERALFEIGNVYRPAAGTTTGTPQPAGRVPGVIEETMVAGVCIDAPTLESVASALSELLGVEVGPLSNSISSAMQQKLKYRLPVHGFEFSLTELLNSIDTPVPAPRSLAAIQAEPVEARQFTPLPKYPSVYRDLSVIVDATVRIEQVQEAIERIGGVLVADVDLFDTFESAEGKVSYSFHIEYRSVDRTMSGDEVAALHNTLVASLRKQLGATIKE